jgi:hypothetical protein
MTAEADRTTADSSMQVELRAEINQGVPAEFAEAAVRSIVARLTEAPTNLHQSTSGLPAHFPVTLHAIA